MLVRVARRTAAAAVAEHIHLVCNGKGVRGILAKMRKLKSWWAPFTIAYNEKRVDLVCLGISAKLVGSVLAIKSDSEIFTGS